MRTILLLALLFIPSELYGTEGVYQIFAEFPNRSSADCYNGVCPIPQGRGIAYYTGQGTGVAVSNFNGYCWLLTTEHVVGKNPRVQINGQQYPVSVEVVWGNPNVKEGVVLLRTRSPVAKELIGMYKLATSPMEEHATAYMVGYPAGRYSSNQQVSCSLKKTIIETRGPTPVPGISGGALLHNRQLHGLVIGYDKQKIGLHQRLDILAIRMESEFPDLKMTYRQFSSAPPATLPPTQVQPIRIEEIQNKKSPPDLLPIPQPEPLPPPKEPERIVPQPTTPAPQPTVPDTKPPVFEPPWQPDPPWQEPPKIPQEGIIEKAEGLIDNIPWYSLLKIAGVTLGVGTGSGVGLYAGLAAFRLLRTALSPRRNNQQGAGFPESVHPNTNPLARDNTELQQIISVRQQEQREPLHDAFYGIAFEDEYRTNPDQSLRQAWQSASDRFNNVAPLSSRNQTVKSSFSRNN